MPTVFKQKGYEFFFYPFDLDEPIHIHVFCQGKEAKFWLAPIECERPGRFNADELSTIERIIKQRTEEIRQRWDAEQKKRQNR